MSQTSKRKFFLLTLVLAVITIPLHNNLNSWALILFCFAAVIQQPPGKSIERLKKDNYWKLSAIFFIWMVATWFWDNSGGFSMKQVETNAIFLFLPLIIAIMPELSPRELMLACFSFIASVVAVCLICLIKSFIEYQQTHDFRVFFYHYLGYQMGLNAIYLSNYCIACITWLLYYKFIYKGEKIVRLNTGITFLISAFLFLMMFLLSSKLSLALVLVLILFMAFYIGYRKKILFRTFILLAFTIILSAVLARNLDYLNWRISGLKFKEYTGPDDNQNGFALRLTTWQSAIELISEKPILGYGLKGANDALVEKYEEKNFTMGIPERYNSHNQFLETTLKSGIIGLVLLLLLIGVPLVSSIRKQQFLLTIMILHFVLVSMVEGTMEIQQELIFYWFFIFLFYYHYPTVNKKTIVPEK